jgi:hypothetical protein
MATKLKYLLITLLLIQGSYTIYELTLSMNYGDSEVDPKSRTVFLMS